MSPTVHAATAAGLGLAGGIWPEGRVVFWPAAFAHVAMDLDHIPDYLFHRGSRGLRKFFRGRIRPVSLLWDFVDACNATEPKRLVLALHSWEIWLAALAVSMAAGLPWLLGASLGGLLHIGMDFGNGPRLGLRITPLSFSLLHRWRCGFRTDRFFPRRNQSRRKSRGG